MTIKCKKNILKTLFFQRIAVYNKSIEENDGDEEILKEQDESSLKKQYSPAHIFSPVEKKNIV